MYEKKCQLLIKHIISDEVIDICEGEQKETRKVELVIEDEIYNWIYDITLYSLCLAKNMIEIDIEKYIVQYYNKKIINNKSTSINMLYPLLTMSFLNKVEHQSFINKQLKLIINDFPRTLNDTYTKLDTNKICIDTILNVVLVMFNEGQKQNDSFIIEEAKYQMLQHIGYLYNDESKLFYHSYDVTNNMFCCEESLLNGNGLMLYSLCNILTLIDDRHESFYRYCKTIFCQCCKKIIKFQNPNGLWNTLLDENAFNDVSGSSLIATSFFIGYKLDILSVEFYRAALKAVKAVAQNVKFDCNADNGGKYSSLGQLAECSQNNENINQLYEKPLALILLLTYRQMQN